MIQSFSSSSSSSSPSSPSLCRTPVAWKKKKKKKHYHHQHRHHISFLVLVLLLFAGVASAASAAADAGDAGAEREEEEKPPPPPPKNHHHHHHHHQHHSSSTTRIAFGSCHKNRKATVPSIWERIIAQTKTTEQDDDDDDVHDDDSSIHKQKQQQQQQVLDAFVWTGDSIYPGHRDPTTGKKRYGPASPFEIQQALDEMKTNATIGYTQLLLEKDNNNNNIPIYGTVDDHDFGGNDFGKYMPNKKERQEVFWNFLGYRPHDHEGMYHSIEIYEKAIVQDDDDDDDDEEEEESSSSSSITGKGHIKLILLDTRSFRDDHCIPSVAHKLPMGNAIACATRWATAGLNLWKYAKWWGMEGCEKANILGEEQWQWLQNELMSSTADLNIIVSSVQIWTTNPAMESWGQFPKEQERLWNLLQQHYSRATTTTPLASSASSSSSSSSSSAHVGPVIFWSGDVHHGEISGHEGYLEVTSSGLTHHCGEPKLYGRLCRPLLENFHQHRFRNDTYYIGLNYGVLQVDWQTRVATVHVKNALGETMLQVEQPLDMLLRIPNDDHDDNFKLPPYEELPHTWDGHLIPWLFRLLTALLFAAGIARRLLKGTRK